MAAAIPRIQRAGQAVLQGLLGASGWSLRACIWSQGHLKLTAMVPYTTKIDAQVSNQSQLVAAFDAALSVVVQVEHEGQQVLDEELRAWLQVRDEARERRDARRAARERAMTDSKAFSHDLWCSHGSSARETEQ